MRRRKVDGISDAIAKLRTGEMDVSAADELLDAQQRKEIAEEEERRRAEKEAKEKEAAKEAQSEADRERLASKVEALQERYEARQRARRRYDAYLASSREASAAARERQSAMDYAKWDLFTPSDDEDDPWCVHPARAQRRASDAVCHCELTFS